MTHRCRRRVLPLLALAALLAACGGPDVADAPPPPAATLETPQRLPWGDRVSSRVNRLAAHVHAQVHATYGPSRETHHIGRDAAAVAALDGWYAARLPGWTRRPLSLPPEEHAFAFTAGNRLFVLGWLDPLADGRIPVFAMRYGSGG